MSNYKFIVSGGGTGGHIYPAIAIADALKQRYKNAEFLFVGARDRMEMQKVPEAGYAIEGLWISGIQRRLTLGNLLFPVKLISSMLKSGRIIRRFQPDLVIGTGGYASGPLLKVAASKKIPCVIQEQNSFPGITNKWLSRKVDKICVAYDGLERFFPKEKLVKTGNPVRQDLLEIENKKEEALQFFELNKKRTVLLVLGGSLGARKINQLIEQNLDFIHKNNITLLWQCGKLYFDEYKKHESETVKVRPFIKRMDLAYAAADIIISRAGASSVSELCIVGKPVVFIPSPNVAEDHQTKNALAVVSENAAIMLKESDTAGMFQPTLKELSSSSEMQTKLAKNIKKLALPDATKHIVNEIEALL